ncbi:hypothetical protein POJ06DRAFT_238865 [Lipomyces tetrasporus]|uniref:Uncharacterized protein n=1 Tax=Lipomyces tetrasporus TaxID=54092 RepID=A0AAD7VTG6_9ASCO|nr:uncharacterized protein POJ06DRAFT_238865 [Lipomyces tetrasporus]KAJ8100135.1 hypothetical protein POJ06DRAFT_238865 [Lipomyces tetrasporus]
MLYDWPILGSVYDVVSTREKCRLYIAEETGPLSRMGQPYSCPTYRHHVAKACDASKYSVHYVHKKLLFDNAVYLKAFLAQIINATAEPHLMVSRALEVGIVDLAVYRASQQLRLIRNTKLGKVRSLRMVGEDGAIFFPRTPECVVWQSLSEISAVCGVNTQATTKDTNEYASENKAYEVKTKTQAGT